MLITISYYYSAEEKNLRQKSLFPKLKDLCRRVMPWTILNQEVKMLLKTSLILCKEFAEFP